MSPVESTHSAFVDGFVARFATEAMAMLPPEASRAPLSPWPDTAVGGLSHKGVADKVGGAKLRDHGRAVRPEEVHGAAIEQGQNLDASGKPSLMCETVLPLL